MSRSASSPACSYARCVSHTIAWPAELLSSSAEEFDQSFMPSIDIVGHLPYGCRTQTSDVSADLFVRVDQMMNSNRTCSKCWMRMQNF